MKSFSRLLLVVARLMGLMSEVLEGHIRFHLVERAHERKSSKTNAVEDVISIAKSYLK